MQRLPPRLRDQQPMNEAETRAECIDPALRAAGWGVVEGSKVLREHPITLGRLEGAKPLTSVYVLIYRGRKLVVVDAKAWAGKTPELRPDAMGRR